MQKSEYRLPPWINAIWLAVLTPLIVLHFVLGHNGRDVWGTISVLAFTVLCVGTMLYNKARTGRFLPRRKLKT